MKLLNKIRQLPILNKKPDLNIDLDSIKNQVGDGFFNILLSTYSEREDDLNNSLQDADQAKAIVEKYSNANMLIAGSAAIVPGPLGIFTAIPELILSVSNQMKMVYDLGCAHDKESFLNQDLLLEIPIYALGGDTNLANLQFADDMPESPENILKDKAYQLGNGMLQKSLKQSLVTWVPIGGSVIMTVWSKMSSKKIANSSLTFYDNSKTFVDSSISKHDPAFEAELGLQKIKLMINLLESDREISEDEIRFITPIIENADIPIVKKESLLKEANQLDSDLPINYDFLNKCEEDIKDTLFCDLIVMAKRDGQIKAIEKEFLLNLANHLNYDKELVAELLI